MNSDKTAYLEKVRAGRGDIEIHTGDTNPYLKQLLPTMKYDDYRRALCLLDPYKLQLDWEVVQIAGQLRTIDMFLNFPIMDINRNVLRHNRRKVAPEDIDRMNMYWGGNSWEDIAYFDTGQLSMLGSEPDMQKQSNEKIVAAFRERLQKVAGFAYVPQPLAMTNSRNAVVYYLFFASANDTGRKIVTDIFKKYAGRNARP